MPESAVLFKHALRNALLRTLHAEPSEWDLVDADTGALDRAGVRVRPVAVYLEDLRSPFNVGSIFRTADPVRTAPGGRAATRRYSATNAT